MKIIRQFYNYLIKKYFGSIKLFYALRANKNNFVSIIPRPKLSSFYFRSSDKTDTPDFAIVIQGRSVVDNDFTLETIKLYNKSFNNPTIIISTHKGADLPETLAKLEQVGAKIIISPKPNPGPFNINLQITSTVAGLKEAKRLGFEYAIKTRSDIRLYAVNISQFIYNLLKQFPIESGLRQKERLISTNVFTLKYRPYSLSDMTVAGRVDDLLLYFDVPLDKRQSIKLGPQSTVDDYFRERPGEIYLETEFLKKIGKQPTGTLEDSWQTFAKHFCVIDQQNLDSYWYKNDLYGCRENKFLIYDEQPGKHDLNFREWFNLYCKYDKLPK